jgi:hypothetical protein
MNDDPKRPNSNVDQAIFEYLLMHMIHVFNNYVYM